MNEYIREFLLETHEGLAQFDLDMVLLEKQPKDSETLARAFRTLHTIKGSTGFLGFKKLQAVGHSSESLLSRLRAGELDFNADIASTLLSVVDAIRRRLASIEQAEDEGDGDDSALIETLELLKNTGSLGPPAPVEAAPIAEEAAPPTPPDGVEPSDPPRPSTRVRASPRPPHRPLPRAVTGVPTPGRPRRASRPRPRRPSLSPRSRRSLAPRPSPTARSAWTSACSISS